MDGCRRPAAPPAWQTSAWRADEPELGVFTAERYFNGAEDALWCDRSSSAFSTVLRTWQHDAGSAPTPTAATSSSEASWNSRSALLPNGRCPVVAAAAAAVDGKPNSSMTGSAQTGRTPPSSSSSLSHLRRWLLGMAGCGCACVDDGQESVSADDDAVEAGFVDGDTKGLRTEADATLPRKRVDDGNAFLTGTATPSPLLPAEPALCRAVNSGELSSMPRMLNPAPPNASYGERRRREILESLHKAPAAAGQGSSRLVSSANQSSAFTIVAGNSTTRGGACRSPPGGSGVDEDAAAPSELGCMYPPSEASVVWSVVTAEGPASVGNFSSAASGCYYYFNNGDGEAFRGINTIKRRNRNNSSGGGLLAGCMSRRAVDAVGPLRACAYRPEVVEPSPVPRVSGHPDVTSHR